MSIFNCKLKYTKIEGNALQSTKNKFIVNGFIDKYNNILDLPKFRIGNTETSEQASNLLGKKVRVFAEESGGLKALPMFEVFREINKTNIIKKSVKEKSDKLEKERFQEEARLKQLREGYDGKEDLNASDLIHNINLLPNEKSNYNPNQTFSELLQEVTSFDTSHIEGINFAKLDSIIQYEKERDNFNWITRGQRTLGSFNSNTYFRGLMEKTFKEVSTEQGGNKVDALYYTLFNIAKITSNPNSLFKRLENYNKLKNGKPHSTKIQIQLTGLVNDGIYYNTETKSIVINIETFLNKISDNILDSQEKYDRLERTITEELIHSISSNLITKEEENIIFNELSEKEKTRVRKIYKNDLTDKQLVHEYLRIVAQQKKFGEITELGKRTIYNVFKRALNYIINAFDNKPIDSVTKQTVNSILQIINDLENNNNNLNENNLYNLQNTLKNEILQSSNRILSAETSSNTGFKLLAGLQQQKFSDNTTELSRFQISDSLQKKLSGKTFKEIWSSKEFTSDEQKSILFWNIQQRFVDKNTFNGKLYRKLSLGVGQVYFNLVNNDAIFYTQDNTINLDINKFYNYLKNNNFEDIDKYLELAVSEELIHLVTNKIITQEQKGAVLLEQIKNDKNFLTNLKGKYRNLIVGDFFLAYHEFIRMGVQNYFFNANTTETNKFKKTILEDLISNVWEYLKPLFTLPNTKRQVDDHIAFIKGSLNALDSEKELEEYNNTEQIWGIADSYQEYKDFKDKHKDLSLEQLIVKFTKYKTEKELGGQENINLDCL